MNAKTWKLIAELDCSSPTMTSEITKIFKEQDVVKGGNQLRLVDKSQYKIPITKPQLNDKTPPIQGIGLLEFSYQDNYIACRNGIKYFIQIICLILFGFGTFRIFRLKL